MKDPIDVLMEGLASELCGEGQAFDPRCLVPFQRFVYAMAEAMVVMDGESVLPGMLSGKVYRFGGRKVEDVSPEERMTRALAAAALQWEHHRLVVMDLSKDAVSHQEAMLAEQIEIGARVIVRDKENKGNPLGVAEEAIPELAAELAELLMCSWRPFR